jgi:DNA-binding NarL/FixJ family response regulator
MVMADGALVGSVPVRTALVEPNPLIVAALTGLFERDPRFSLTATLTRGSELIAAARRQEVSLAVVSWRLADGSAAELLREVKARELPLRVIVFSNDDDLDLVRRAVRLGAHGYCYQFDDPSILFETLHTVARGRICIPDIDVTRLNDTPLAQLTVRERELLDMLSRGWTNLQVANRTGISENTVKYHLKNLYDKLDVRNRAMAVALYTREKDG